MLVEHRVDDSGQDVALYSRTFTYQHFCSRALANSNFDNTNALVIARHLNVSIIAGHKFVLVEFTVERASCNAGMPTVGGTSSRRDDS